MRLRRVYDVRRRNDGRLRGGSGRVSVDCCVCAATVNNDVVVTAVIDTVAVIRSLRDGAEFAVPGAA